MQAGNWLLYSEYANYGKDVVAGSVEYHGHNSSNQWIFVVYLWGCGSAIVICCWAHSIRIPRTVGGYIRTDLVNSGRILLLDSVNESCALRLWNINGEIGPVTQSGKCSGITESPTKLQVGVLRLGCCTFVGFSLFNGHLRSVVINSFDHVTSTIIAITSLQNSCLKIADAISSRASNSVIPLQGSLRFIMLNMSITIVNGIHLTMNTLIRGIQGTKITEPEYDNWFAFKYWSTEEPFSACPSLTSRLVICRPLAYIESLTYFESVSWSICNGQCNTGLSGLISACFFYIP